MQSKAMINPYTIYDLFGYIAHKKTVIARKPIAIAKQNFILANVAPKATMYVLSMYAPTRIAAVTAVNPNTHSNNCFQFFSANALSAPPPGGGA